MRDDSIISEPGLCVDQLQCVVADLFYYETGLFAERIGAWAMGDRLIGEPGLYGKCHCFNHF